MTPTFATYKSFLGRCNAADFQDESASKPRLLIPASTDGRLRTYYAPFDYVNTEAHLVIVGITPGRTQMNKANQAACLAIRAGMTDEETLLRAKKAASFGGEMRDKLTELLDHSGVNKRLGISSCKSLWDQHNELVHFTSVLRNPVFSIEDSEEKNYTGSSPTLAIYKGFSAQRSDFRAELLSISKKALILPLGAKVAHAIQALVKSGAIPLSSVLNADGKVAEFPHPSGQNAETVNLALMASPLPKDAYCQFMLGKYLSKKRDEGKTVSAADKNSHMNRRAGYWMRDQHTRRALRQLMA